MERRSIWPKMPEPDGAGVWPNEPWIHFVCAAVTLVVSLSVVIYVYGSL